MFLLVLLPAGLHKEGIWRHFTSRLLRIAFAHFWWFSVTKQKKVPLKPFTFYKPRREVSHNGVPCQTRPLGAVFRNHTMGRSFSSGKLTEDFCHCCLRSPTCEQPEIPKGLQNMQLWSPANKKSPFQATWRQLLQWRPHSVVTASVSIICLEGMNSIERRKKSTRVPCLSWPSGY